MDIFHHFKKKEIRTQISGLMIGKLSDTSRNSFDSIVLSTLFGLTTVAIYNNYYYIHSSIYGIMIIVAQAMQASIGNSIASESVQKNYDDLRKIQFLFLWLTSWCTTCLLCLYQPFMQVWVGPSLMLSDTNMMLFSLYFYVLTMNGIRNLYFAGNGLWWAGKVSFILEAVFNLVLNIVLGKLMGITGVILATIITIVVFNFYFRTIILFKTYFKRSPIEFNKDHIVFFACCFVSSFVSYIATTAINITGIAGLIIQAIICIVLPNIILLLLLFKNREFNVALTFAKSIINKKKR